MPLDLSPVTGMIDTKLQIQHVQTPSVFVAVLNTSKFANRGGGKVLAAFPLMLPLNEAFKPKLKGCSMSCWYKYDARGTHGRELFLNVMFGTSTHLFHHAIPFGLLLALFLTRRLFKGVVEKIQECLGEVVNSREVY